MTALTVRSALNAVAAIFRWKAAPEGATAIYGEGRGWRSIFESFPGSYQADVEIERDAVLSQDTVFACTTLIASDIAKLGVDLVERDEGIWKIVNSAAFSPVLRKPNSYQTWQQFVENWITSKLSTGNTYILKQRDDRGVVVAMYVLDPHRVTPLVADDGSVYYRLGADNLARIPDGEEPHAVPASEIIHDRFNCLHHPLVGLSPISASGLSATQALQIQRGSAKFFRNSSRPSGMLTAPAKISDELAGRLKQNFESKFSGENVGRVFIAGDGLSYTPMAVNAVDAQLVDQLKISALQVCATYHVPPHLVGASAEPTYSTTEALQRYFAQCLQSLIRSLELCLTEGLGLSNVPRRELRIQVNLDDLLRMDQKTLTEVEGLKVQRSISAPNEARQKFNLPPVEGGDSPLAQQQEFSLAALSKRDALPNPFAPTEGEPAPTAAKSFGSAADEEEEMTPSQVRALLDDLLGMVEGRLANGLPALVQRVYEEHKGALASMAAEPVKSAVEEKLSIAEMRLAAGLPAMVNRVFLDHQDSLAARAAHAVPVIVPARGERGEDGKDGKDGFSPEDLELEMEADGRTLVIAMRGDGKVVRKSIRFDGMPQHRDVYQNSRTYSKGDCVVYGSAYWLAKQETNEPPRGAGNHWQLVLKGNR